MEFSPLSLPFLAEINVFDFSWISTPEAWVSLLTLAALEIVRRRATLPELDEYERMSGVHRGPIVQQPMRVALR